MIDEIPIIGVIEWTVDGLAAKEFRRRPKMPLSRKRQTKHRSATAGFSTLLPWLGGPSAGREFGDSISRKVG
jgi:hypothetical protein